MKKLLIGFLVLVNISAFANCNVEVTYDKEVDFLAQTDCPGCGDNWYGRRQTKKQKRKSQFELRLAEELQRNGFKLVNGKSMSNYRLHLKILTVVGEVISARATLTHDQKIIEMNEKLLDYNFLKTFWRVKLEALENAVENLRTTCDL